MPIFTALFWQGVLTACLLLPFAHGAPAHIEGFAADWRAELVLAVVWLAVGRRLRADVPADPHARGDAGLGASDL